MELGIQFEHANTIIAELLASGVRKFFLCPGNQSSPLAAALALRPDNEVEFHFDERAAGFMALGYAKASSRPAALVCTSGTAVANLYPAVLEAQYSQTPLILLTADRPDELLDVAANQTCKQTGVFAEALRWSCDLAAPVAESYHEQRPVIRSSVDYGVYRAQAHPAGAVQFNVRFRKPFFESIASGLKGSNSRAEQDKVERSRHTQYAVSNLAVAEPEVRRIAQLLRKAKSGLILVGGLGPFADRQVIEQLAQALQWPIWASVISGMRTKNFSGLCYSHWYLSSAKFRQQYQADLVLHLGFEAPKPGNSVVTYAEQSDALRVCVSEYASRQDPVHSGGQRIESEPSAFAQQLLAHIVETPSSLREPFYAAEQTVGSLIVETLQEGSQDERLSSLAVVRKVCHSLTAEQQLCIANSLPIRLADFAADQAAADLVSNRGLSGIDGLLATAAGAHFANDKQTIVLCGDLSFLHDLNTLALISRKQLPLVIVVINNDGGQIFSVVDRPDLGERFDELMCTPHAMQFAEIAKWAKLDYQRPASMKEFRDSFDSSIRSGKSSILEVVVDPQECSGMLKHILGEVENALQCD